LWFPPPQMRKLFPPPREKIPTLGEKGGNLGNLQRVKNITEMRPRKRGRNSIPNAEGKKKRKIQRKRQGLVKGKLQAA